MICYIVIMHQDLNLKHSLYESLSSHFIRDVLRYMPVTSTVDYTRENLNHTINCLLGCSERFELQATQHTSAEHGPGRRSHLRPAPATTVHGHSEDTGEIPRWSDLQGEEGSELMEVPIHIL